MTEPAQPLPRQSSMVVPDAMVHAAARALAPHVSGVDPLDRWTLDTARAALVAGLEALGLVMPVDDPACHDGTCSYRAEIHSGYYVVAEGYAP